MCGCKKTIKVDESYVSFKNIDCFENACCVVDHILALLKKPENNNAYWEKFVGKIPEGYYARDVKKDPKELLLYMVCSSASNIFELFENAEDEEGVFAMQKCEQECC
ncbi:MAG: N(2)-fixation sustaining protein CowN [Deferribacterales bacterium]